MVSTFNMVLMLVCVVVGIAAAAVPYLMISRRSSALETGLPGAFGYGVLGYVWQYVFYIFGGGVFLYRLPFWGSMNGTAREVLLNVLLTILTTLCTVAALYWGIYLTNQKKISIYRSATVGIGFGLGRIALDLVYPYCHSFYFALQINGGTYHGKEELKNSIISTSSASLVSGTYKCVLMLVIVLDIALIMGNYYISKNKKMAWIYPLAVYEVIMLLNALPRLMFGNREIVAEVVVIVIYTIVAAAAGVDLYRWFKTGQIEGFEWIFRFRTGRKAKSV